MDAFNSGVNAVNNLFEAPIEQENRRLDLQKKKALWEEYSKAKADEVKAKEIMSDDLTPKPVAPSGFMPGESGGMPTSLPFYKTMLGGFGTPEETPIPQEPGAITPTETKAAPNPLTAMQTSANEVQAAQSRLDQIKGTADKMRKAGLFDQADKYEAKQTELYRTFEDAQTKHFKNQAEVFKMTGGLAKSYLDSSKVQGADKDALWNRLILNAGTMGFPIDQLRNVPPEQRDAFATQVYNDSMAADGKNKMAIAKMQEDRRDKRHEDIMKVRNDTLDVIRKRDAWRKEQGEQKLDWEKDKFGITKHIEDVNKRVSEAQNQIKEVDKDISNLEDTKTDLIKGNLFYAPSTGLPLDFDEDEEVQKEVKYLDEKIKEKNITKDELNKYITDLDTERAKLTKGMGRDVERAVPRIFNPDSSYRFVRNADPESVASYKRAMEANKKDPNLPAAEQARRQKNRIEIQRKAFEAGLVEPK